jgi:hypothetical protein
MKSIVIIRNDSAYHGNIVQAANFIGVTPTTISRWISKKKGMVYFKCDKIYVNTEKLKS